jgi:hypothetical protein
MVYIADCARKLLASGAPGAAPRCRFNVRASQAAAACR